MSSDWIRPHVARMAGYVPGEQPRDGQFVKLNTNENPYPPSPQVARAIAGGLDGRLRLYPDPVATALREAAARLHRVEPDMILAGNGSDDLLTILTRALVSPGDTIVYPTPSYILYRTLAELQDAKHVEVPYRDDWTLDPERFAVPGARVTFLANPNSPSGTRLDAAQVGTLADRIAGPLVVDEAYVNFAAGDCVELVRSRGNVVVLRTFSKGYGLAGLRLGYLIGPAPLVAELGKVKDSYNCDTLSLLGGVAALGDQAYLAETRARIIATRQRMTAALRGMGYQVPESEANFVWCDAGPPAADVYARLKERRILVRLMRYPGRPDGLRITVGTDEEADRLLVALGEIVGCA